MTVERMMNEMSSSEYTHWIAFMILDAKDQRDATIDRERTQAMARQKTRPMKKR